MKLDYGRGHRVVPRKALGRPTLESAILLGSSNRPAAVMYRFCVPETLLGHEKQAGPSAAVAAAQPENGFGSLIEIAHFGGENRAALG